MIITCPACATRYDLPEGAIGPAGRTVRCANCRESWFAAAPGDEDAASDGSPPVSMSPETAPSGSDAAPASSALASAPAPTPAPPPVFARLPLVAPLPADRGASPSTTAANPVDGDEGPSSFAYEPPFRPRRRKLKAWLLAVLGFLLLVLAIGVGLVWNGTPDWLPIANTSLAASKPGLVLDFPKDRIERRTLADGTEFFGARGTITNVGAARQSVPPLLIVLRDDRKREVYRWEVVPPKRQLAPGETITINEAVTDIPKSAITPEIGWKAG